VRNRQIEFADSVQETSHGRVFPKENELDKNNPAPKYVGRVTLGTTSPDHQKRKCPSLTEPVGAKPLSGHVPGPLEPRNKPRYRIPFIARVRGADIHGHIFEVHTVVENLSAKGLFLRLPREVALGAKLFLVITLSTRPAEGKSVAQIAMRAVVLRADRGGDGLWSVAMKVERYRFLSNGNAGSSGTAAKSRPPDWPDFQ
jgi:PilZ domain